jgi:hypothetical protein
MNISEKVKHYIAVWKAKRFWKGDKGAALALKCFDMYTNSDMFYERVKEFGSIESVKMFTYEEFNFFKRKAMDDEDILFTIMRNPGIIIEELGKKDKMLKSHVSM